VARRFQRSAGSNFFLKFDSMNQKTGRKLKRFLLAIIILYVLGGIVLYFIQDLLLFHPKAVAKDHHYSFGLPYEELNLPFGKNNLNIIQFKTTGPKKGLVLFYHGNMKNVEHYAKYPPLFIRNGYDVWMIDYPGFGKTTGKRNEKILFEQALLMYDMAAKSISSDSIIIYGKSIGTGIASHVAANRKSKRLILETPYYSINALARHYFPIYPVVPMTRYTLPVYEDVQKVDAPIIFFHGTKDEVVPYSQSVRIKNEMPSVELITIKDGKHNNLSSFELFRKKLDSLLLN
jgi:uncharacterized protein